MSKQCKRDFKVNQTVYLIDYWGNDNGLQAFGTIAEILRVDNENKTFDALLFGDMCQRYSFEDYGCLIFNTAKEADEAANKLPKPKSIVYQKIGKRVYKKTVIGIEGYHVNGVYALEICLNRGKGVSIKEIGISIFLSEADARQ